MLLNLPLYKNLPWTLFSPLPHQLSYFDLEILIIYRLASWEANLSPFSLSLHTNLLTLEWYLFDIWHLANENTQKRTKPKAIRNREEWVKRNTYVWFPVWSQVQKCKHSDFISPPLCTKTEFPFLTVLNKVLLRIYDYTSNYISDTITYSSYSHLMMSLVLHRKYLINSYVLPRKIIEFGFKKSTYRSLSRQRDRQQRKEIFGFTHFWFPPWSLHRTSTTVIASHRLAEHKPLWRGTEPCARHWGFTSLEAGVEGLGGISAQ